MVTHNKNIVSFFMFCLIAIPTQVLSEYHDPEDTKTILPISPERDTPVKNYIEYTPSFAPESAYWQSKYPILIDLLDSIQSARNYYLSIQEYPYTYCISQSPFHWVWGRKQSDLKKEALEELNTMQADIAAYLGKSTLHPLRDELEDIQTYEKKMRQKIQKLQEPSHLRRNWLPYTALITATTLTYWYAKKHPKTIEALMTKTTHNATYFWNEHVKRPYYDLKDTFLSDGPSTHDLIKTEKEAQRQMVSSYLKDTHAKTLSLEEIDGIALQAAEHGNLQKIMDDWAKESKNSNWNIINGNTLRLAKIQAQQLKIEILKEKLRTDGLLAILTVLPASVILGATYYLGSKAVSFLHPKKMVPKNIGTYLINLQDIYRHNLHTNAFSFYDTGMHMYWITKLRNLVQEIPFNDRNEFIKNLEELASDMYSHEQKTLLINQMFKRFSFL